MGMFMARMDIIKFYEIYSGFGFAAAAGFIESGGAAV